VADDDRLLDIKAGERFIDEFGLLCRCPDPRAWPVGVTKPRAVDGDDTKPFGQPVENAADREVMDHGTIAVQQDERRSLAAFDVVNSDILDIEESTGGRMILLG
jgi:hypothetical protein